MMYLIKLEERERRERHKYLLRTLLVSEKSLIKKRLEREGPGVRYLSNGENYFQLENPGGRICGKVDTKNWIIYVSTFRPD